MSIEPVPWGFCRLNEGENAQDYRHGGDADENNSRGRQVAPGGAEFVSDAEVEFRVPAGKLQVATEEAELEYRP